MRAARCAPRRCRGSPARQFCLLREPGHRTALILAARRQRLAVRSALGRAAAHVGRDVGDRLGARRSRGLAGAGTAPAVGRLGGWCHPHAGTPWAGVGVRRRPSSGYPRIGLQLFTSLLFDQAPEAMQQTLLSVAFLPHATAAMAKTLSDREDAGEWLEQLTAGICSPIAARRLSRSTSFTLSFGTSFRCVPPPAWARPRSGAPRSDQPTCWRPMERSRPPWTCASTRAIGTRLWARCCGPPTNCSAADAGRRWIAGSRRSRPLSAAAQPQLLYWLGMAQVQTAPMRGIETLRQALPLCRSAGDGQGEILCLTGLLNAAFLGFVALEAMDEWLDRAARPASNGCSSPRSTWNCESGAFFARRCSGSGHGTRGLPERLVAWKPCSGVQAHPASSLRPLRALWRPPWSAANSTAETASPRPRSNW